MSEREEDIQKLFVEEIQKVETEMRQVQQTLISSAARLVQGTKDHPKKHSEGFNNKARTSLVREGFPVTHSENEGLDKKIRLEYDIKSFKPEDVNVVMAGNKLTVQADQEEMSDGFTFLRKYSEGFEFPEEIDPKTIKIDINPEGILVVEADSLSAPKNHSEN